MHDAIRGAAAGPVEEGGVGAGTGMITCDFAAGIGTASRRVELDSSDTLFAMVAAGVGWAITTPLCVLQARRTDGLAFLPLPGPGCLREVSLFGRAGEYEALADRLGTLACETLQDDCLPGLRKLMPWLGESFVVAERVAATT